MLKVSIVQMNASSNMESNLSRMEEFVKVAKHQGGELIAFPEMAYYQGTQPSQEVPYSELISTFGKWASRYQIEILPGSVREPAGNGQFYNSLPYLDPSGKEVSRYRKLFLFQARLGEKTYDETLDFVAGKDVCAVTRPWGTAGLAICFDLRFPELFRSLKKKGAQVVFLPSSFTVPTGSMHWHVLTRSRAIENQFFIVAPAQVGRNGKGQDTFGHSVVISPWGEIRVDLGNEETIQTVDISLEEISLSAKRVDSWGCRREDIFRIC